LKRETSIASKKKGQFLSEGGKKRSDSVRLLEKRSINEAGEMKEIRLKKGGGELNNEGVTLKKRKLGSQ